MSNTATGPVPAGSPAEPASQASASATSTPGTPSAAPSRRSRLLDGTAGEAPWARLARDFATALALADGAEQLRGEPRRALLNEAARQLRRSTQQLDDTLEDES
jgi:hypothetical protein